MKTASPPEWSSIPMDPDEAFEAIANSRRRRVLLSLARASEAVSASDLAVEIAAVENQVDPSDVTGQMRTRVYIALTQKHLTKLDDLGAVEYDPRSKQVQATESTASLAVFIRQLQTSCYSADGQDAETTQHTDDDTGGKTV